MIDRLAGMSKGRVRGREVVISVTLCIGSQYSEKQSISKYWTLNTRPELKASNRSRKEWEGIVNNVSRMLMYGRGRYARN